MASVTLAWFFGHVFRVVHVAVCGVSWTDVVRIAHCYSTRNNAVVLETDRPSGQRGRGNEFEVVEAYRAGAGFQRKVFALWCLVE